MILSMPTSAPHPCGSPGCSALVPRGRSRCELHQHAAEATDRQQRGSSAERGYDSRWQRYRVVFLAANPLCKPCDVKGRTSAATVVDHITPHKGDHRLFWEPTNHQPSCKPCHDARVDEGDFGRKSA